MAITSEQGTKILKVVVGLFNGGISAGNLTGLVTLIDQGASVADLSDRLATGSLFTDNILGGNFTVSNQVNVMMNNFGLVADSDPTSAGSQAKQFFIDTISGGVGLGAIVNEAVDFLSQDNVPAEFAATAALLDNKAVVAEIYAGKNPPDDFTTMIALFADVTATSPATRDDAIAFVDLFDASNISLTSEVDNLASVSEIGIFIGDKNTASAADSLFSGGSDLDILRLFNTHITPNISGIEKVVYTSPGGDINVADFADVTSVELKNAVPGHTITTTQGQAVTLTNINEILFTNQGRIELAGNSVTSLDLTLDQVGSFTDRGTLFLSGTELATLNIKVVNNASTLFIDGARDLISLERLDVLKTLNIAGDQDFTADLFVGRGNLTIDASSASGKIVIKALGSNDTFKGGSGDDTIMFLGSFDTLIGGAGIDTLGAVESTINSVSAVANISEFEIFEAFFAGTYDLSFLNAKNALTGLTISHNNSGPVVINNINLDSTGNIRLTPPPNNGDRNIPSQVILNATDFIAGGRGDDATITLDNNQFRSSGISAEVTFPSLDFLHLVSKSNGFPDSQFGRPDENTLRLKATDLDEIRITGDESLSLFITDRPSQIDASGLDAPLGIFFSRETRSPELSPFTVEIRGTSYDDHYFFGNFATETSFLFTGGGSDVVTYGDRATDKHFMIFTATELNAGDLKAGDATIVNLVDVGVGATVTIELSSALEGLLKSGGTFLSETNANIDIHSTSLSNTTNIAAQSFNSVIAVNDNQLITQSTLDLQFDLNGDGNYSASDDAQIRLIASNSDQITINGTLVYDAAADALIYTVV